MRLTVELTDKEKEFIKNISNDGLFECSRDCIDCDICPFHLSTIALPINPVETTHCLILALQERGEQLL